MSRLALVTGGAGFIGSHLVDGLLDAGWRVRVLDNLTTGLREHVSKRAEFVCGDVGDDLTSLQACEQVDTVFHLAARVSVRDSFDFMVEHNTSNVTATLVLLKAAAAAGVRRFVFTSSMAVYSEGTAGSPIDEKHATRPRSPYGIAKLAAEEYLCLAAPWYGVQPVILRLFNTYGARQSYSPYVGVATIFVTRLLKGLPCTIFGDGEQCRDFVHVGDVARGCLLAADSDAAVGQRINIGSGHGTTVNELATLICALTGKTGAWSHESPASGELLYSVADIARAKQLLGYEPRARIEDRLLDVIDGIRLRTK